MMMIKEPKRWLAIATLVLLTSVFAAAQHGSRPGPGGGGGDGWGGGGGCSGGGNGWGNGWGDNRNQQKPCQSVPDGGSSAGYLLAVGASSVGAIFVRSRLSKPRLS
jgi:hypothetical protein